MYATNSLSSLRNAGTPLYWKELKETSGSVLRCHKPPVLISLLGQRNVEKMLQAFRQFSQKLIGVTADLSHK